MLYRMIFQRRYRLGWDHRFGYVPRRFSSAPCIWIHAVSMGEINAVASLLTRLEEILPQHEIVISSTTDTGYARARKLYGQTHRVFFYPFDFSRAVNRAFNRIRPQLCILMELELWHNFSFIAHRRAIPVVVANGRISSAKGFPRYKKIAPLVRPMFGRVTRVFAQDHTYAKRFEFLGVPAEKVEVVGSLKYDTAQVSDQVDGAELLKEQLQLNDDDPLWVAGSTGPGEERIILDSYRQLLKVESLEKICLAIVPRKPERFDEVARLIESADFQVLRFSRIKDGADAATEAEGNCVILGDTMGDLRKFYSLSAVIFVGRSLVPMGGSDMIEAAALAKPIVLGPYTENFAETVQALEQAQAIEIAANPRDLTVVTEKLLTDKTCAQQIAQRARQVIIDHQGATEKTVAAIVEILGYRMPLDPAGIATPALVR